MSRTEPDLTSWLSSKEPYSFPFNILSRVLSRMESRIAFGQIEITFPSNFKCLLRGRAPGIDAAVKFTSWSALVQMLLQGDLGFADAFILGNIESPDLLKLFGFVLQNPSATTVVGLERSRPSRRLWHLLNRNTLKGSRRNIMAHYDLGNEFYSQWLDIGMNYSSAFYTDQSQTLEEAQEQKLDRAIELLDLQPGNTVLEIGCGWGALAQRMARVKGASVHGITLSPAQLAFAGKRVSGDERVNFELRDYRDTTGLYDRIVSIEMLEAVGAEYWRDYFATIRARLRTGGVAVLQVIAIAEERYDYYLRNPDFIQKYIFPGGMLPTRSILERECRAAGLKLVHSEMFGQSYARTLEVWHRRFELSWPEIAKLGFDVRFRRTWEYYLKYCQAGFESGAIDVGFYKMAMA
jgi:cyclopropane-fatty-acyl-phospholipid synthase